MRQKVRKMVMNQSLKEVWERLKSLGRELEASVYGRLNTERRLLVIKDKEDRTLLSTPLLLAVLIGLLLVVWAAPLLLIAVVVALLLKYEFVVVKEVKK